MTLSQAALTPMGIVLTADSRQTYRNSANMTRIGTDNAVKVFQLTQKTGVVIAGRALFPDSRNVFKNTGWFIEEFKKEVLRKNNSLSVKEIAQKLNDYLAKAFIEPEEIRVKAALTSKLTTDGLTDISFAPREGNMLKYSFAKDAQKKEEVFYIDSISLIVAGYDSDNTGKAYQVSIPDGLNENLSRNTEYGGHLRIGQVDVVSRIMHGWDANVLSLDFVKESTDKGILTAQELNKLMYVINWGAMTTQDAVDFCVLMTKITESVQRFSDGNAMYPGGITGVGGAIDVAVISPESGFKWVRKKELSISEYS